MSTDPRAEIETFYQFLGERIQKGSADLSPEESVEAFRAYQRKLDRFRERMQPALDQLNRDLDRLRKELQPALDRLDRDAPAAPFDANDVKRRGRERLAREGITD